MKQRDAHTNDITPDRLRFTAEVARVALHFDNLDWAAVRSYKSKETEVTAILRRKPEGAPVPVRAWPRNMFQSSTAVERGLRRALDPQTEVDDEDQRVRFARASWNNDAAHLNSDDCKLLVKLSTLPPRGEES